MTAAEIADALSEPFELQELKFKPQAVKGNRALAVAYIDARLVMDRLDEVFGPGGWQDAYTPLPSGAVLCTLSVKIDGEWVHKTDVGGESEQPDEGDRVKAAFSDALKRAAVKLGIGRYIYRLSGQWCDFDPAKKQLTSKPQLPAWARPKPQVQTVQAAKKAELAPYSNPAAEPDEPVALTAAKPDAVATPPQPAPTLEVVAKLLKETKKAWLDALRWIDEKCGTKYATAKDVKFGDVAGADMRLFVEAHTPH